MLFPSWLGLLTLLSVQLWQPGNQQPQQAVPWSLLTSVQAPYQLCALLPHLKDTYWLSVHAGMVEQAQALGVGLITMEAGGYDHQATQLAQLARCRQQGSDAVLLGSVRYRLAEEIKIAAQQLPVIAVVNEVEPGYLAGLVGASWYQVGVNLAQVINQKPGHQTLVLMFGPSERGGNRFIEQGLRDTLNPEAKILAKLHGENSLAVQRRLLRRYLAQSEPPDWLLCGALCAESAMSEPLLEAHGTHILSSYLSHSTYQGLRFDRLAFSNDDQMRTQGRLAVDLALRALQGESLPAAMGPPLRGLTPGNLSPARQRQVEQQSLSPPDFQAQFQLAPRVTPAANR
ncbi:TMAO reductase system periplasmic protein TorT [Ferrimonas marina]|uniref:Protein TorT n=1 Tax=Ferrimonas marina TaxID=299255 RepID=A0A1M5VH34_9GAMM|nr:TMAO reductase system periplasmic protein TorT [Ferrimonas marina]SHH74521.1 protein TorT [Ferrimonas marina]